METTSLTDQFNEILNILPAFPKLAVNSSLLAITTGTPLTP